MSKASERAYEIVRGQIVSGELEPGTQIKEEEIAQLCGVSRTPVRDALRRLEAEMFIRRTDSQRSYVAEWSPDDIEDVYMLRSILEARAAALAALRAPQEIRDALHANNAGMADAVRRPRPDVDGFLHLNNDFHRLIIEGAASERLASMLNRLIVLPLIDRTARLPLPSAARIPIGRAR
jgi:DNA-binding GntR family transcriptional regulator